MQVGTYIGERLIYAPSIGFCILLAELLANLAGGALPQILLLWYSGGCKPTLTKPVPSEAAAARPVVAVQRTLKKLAS